MRSLTTAAIDPGIQNTSTDIQPGAATAEDTASIGICFDRWRTASANLMVEELAEFPVYPARKCLTDWMKINLKCLLTIWQFKKTWLLEGLTLVYCGDGCEERCWIVCSQQELSEKNVPHFLTKRTSEKEIVSNLAEGFAKESMHISSSLKMWHQFIKVQMYLHRRFGYHGEEDNSVERVALLKPTKLIWNCEESWYEDLIFLALLASIPRYNIAHGKMSRVNSSREGMKQWWRSSPAANTLATLTARNRMHTIKAAWLLHSATFTFQSIIYIKKPSTTSYEGCDWIA